MASLSRLCTSGTADGAAAATAASTCCDWCGGGGYCGWAGAMPPKCGLWWRPGTPRVFPCGS